MIEVTIPLLFVYILDKSEFLVVMSTLLYSWCELLIRSFLLLILKLMKVELDEAGLNPFLMAQPLGYRTPDVARYGWITLPEFPFGGRVIGECYGFESHYERKSKWKSCFAKMDPEDP